MRISGAAESFRYPAWIGLGAAAAAAVGMGVAVVAACEALADGGAGFLLLAAALAVAPVAFAWLFLASLTITVGEDGLSASCCGLTTSAVAWADIRKIRKSRMPPGRYGGRYSDSYRVFAHRPLFLWGMLPNLGNTIVFTQDIRDRRVLLDRINRYALRHGVPLSESDVRRMPPPGERTSERAVTAF